VQDFIRKADKGLQRYGGAALKPDKGKGMAQEFDPDEIGRGVKSYPFISQLPVKGDWQYAFILGGGMSQAALWCDVDPNTHCIRNRCVRKDTWVHPEACNHETRWYFDRERGTQWPLEYHCLRQVQKRPEGKDLVVQAWHCEVDEPKSLYRLYLHFCPFGDLGRMLWDYEEMHQKYPIYKVPEPFMWYVFDTLVDAGLVLEQGGTENLPPPEEKSWLEIVHRDLKPDNVFLEVPGRGYPRYPMSKLADFGLAFETRRDAPGNPEMWNRGGGTEGYCSKSPSHIRTPFAEGIMLTSSTPNLH
jgi:hypothetical protein